jgi:ankyrin repeat protein
VLTPIYDAVVGDNPENARILIRAGADLNVRGKWGSTPLMAAETHRSYDVMYVLLEAGADFRASTSERGATVVYLMAVHNRLIDARSEMGKKRQKCIHFLEKNGVDFKKVSADVEHELQEEAHRYEQEQKKGDKRAAGTNSSAIRVP